MNADELEISFSDSLKAIQLNLQEPYREGPYMSVSFAPKQNLSVSSIEQMIQFSSSDVCNFSLQQILYLQDGEFVILFQTRTGSQRSSKTSGCQRLDRHIRRPASRRSRVNLVWNEATEIGFAQIL